MATQMRKLLPLFPIEKEKARECHDENQAVSEERDLQRRICPCLGFRCEPLWLRERKTVNGKVKKKKKRKGSISAFG